MALLGRGCVGASSALYLRLDPATTPVQLATTCRAASSQSSGGARRVAVIGGGFVGLSCALHLQRAGHTVVLLDSAALAGPASASFGNAGPPLPEPTCWVCGTHPSTLQRKQSRAHEIGEPISTETALIVLARRSTLTEDFIHGAGGNHHIHDPLVCQSKKSRLPGKPPPPYWLSRQDRSSGGLTPRS